MKAKKLKVKSNKPKRVVTTQDIDKIFTEASARFNTTLQKLTD